MYYTGILHLISSKEAIDYQDESKNLDWFLLYSRHRQRKRKKKKKVFLFI